MECVIVFIRRAWTEQAMETRPGVPQNGGKGLVFDRPRSKQDHVHLEGSGILQNGGNGLVLDLLRSKRGPVDREGCGVPQNGTPRDTVHLHRRPPPVSTGYCSSTVDLLQPPTATVHPRAPVHPASTARYSTGYCSTSPLHGVLFNAQKMNTPPASWDPPWWEADLWAY